MTTFGDQVSKKMPFIYIAALRRTGSTVLSEALSLLPYSFIFREPNLGMNVFSIAQNDAKIFMKLGINLKTFYKHHRIMVVLKRRLGDNQGYMIKVFKNNLLPKLKEHVLQIGVKEIRHDHWRRYQHHFPDMRILLTGRDPRDIYISLYNRYKRGKADWSGIFSPEKVADDLNNQFRHQIEMYKETDCFKLRYEDICINPNLIFSKVKSYIKSPILKIGTVGSFLENTPKRRDEYEVHKNQITNKRIYRWKYEKDQKLISASQRTFDLMPDYCDFWGYRKDPGPINII